MKAKQRIQKALLQNAFRLLNDKIERFEATSKR